LLDIIFQEECSPWGLEDNWKKTKIQSLSDFLPRPGNVVVEGEVVECVTEFIYLGSLTHESCRSIHGLCRRLVITRSAMGVWGGLTRVCGNAATFGFEAEAVQCTHLVDLFIRQRNMVPDGNGGEEDRCSGPVVPEENLWHQME